MTGILKRLADAGIDAAHVGPEPEAAPIEAMGFGWLPVCFRALADRLHQVNEREQVATVLGCGWRGWAWAAAR